MMACCQVRMLEREALAAEKKKGNPLDKRDLRKQVSEHFYLV